MANALLVDYGIITDGKSKEAIDKCKVRRERERCRQWRKQKQGKETEGGKIKCFGFDGKRDRKTLIQTVEVRDGVEKTVQKTGCEEHIVYTAEGDHGGVYLTHSAIPPNKGTGLDLAVDLRDVIVGCGSEESVQAIVMDGTAVNTGWKTGAIACLERLLGFTVLWLVCFLHMNELPLRWDKCII